MSSKTPVLNHTGLRGSRLAGLVGLISILACDTKETGLHGPEIYNLVEELQWAAVAPNDLGAAPRADRDSDVLTLPYGQRLDFYLNVPNGHVLTLGGIESSGKAETTLSVSIQRAGGRERDVGRLAPTRSPRVVPLPDGGSDICRLSLEAHSNDAESGVLQVGRPRIRSISKLAVTGQESANAGGAERPNIILYVIDTLRADHLGVYGYERPVSPSIDLFASQAIVFDNAVAQSPWTRASMASIFTGLEPHLHRVNNFQDALSERALTLAELLSAGGYQTSAFVTNPNVETEFGFGQGFDFFSAMRHRRQGLSDLLNQEVFSFLGSGRLKQPFFLYVHSNEHHAPYSPPERFHETLARGVPLEAGHRDKLREIRWKPEPDPVVSEQVVSLYDAEIASNDWSFGQLIKELENLGLYEDSLMILSSDHGEEFWEHGVLGHGHTLYSELLNVPLILKEPGYTPARRVHELVQHIDLFRTILEYADVEIPDNVHGRSLRRVMEAANDTRAPSIYSVLDLRGVKAVSVTDEKWKLIVPRSDHLENEPELFNLSLDRGEKENLFNKEPIVAAYLLTLLRRHESVKGFSLEAVPATMSKDVVEDLKALGYIH